MASEVYLMLNYLTADTRRHSLTIMPIGILVLLIELYGDEIYCLRILWRQLSVSVCVGRTNEVSPAERDAHKAAKSDSISHLGSSYGIPDNHIVFLMITE